LFVFKISKRHQIDEKNENASSIDETSIIINPSKIIKEIYKEPLLEKKKEEKNRNSLKNLVMYLGSKIFIKDSID
jgi:hypothetical protein